MAQATSISTSLLCRTRPVALARCILVLATGWFLTCSSSASAAADDWEVLTTPSADPDAVTITIAAAKTTAIKLVVDTNDFPVVNLAANFFADDVRRVSGQR